MATTALVGEELRVPERVVVSPVVGVFRPLPPETCTTDGEIVREGQTVGIVHASGREIEVRSPFAGFLMEMLAVDGERVREGQPIAWLRTF
jgi:biotin carboxyl carrier protein